MKSVKESVAFGPIDIHVGLRIKQRRKSLGISQSTLAQAVGIGYQQLQKHESGASRIGAGRLYQISEKLDVPVTYFFDDMPQFDVDGNPLNAAQQHVEFDSDLLQEIEEVARSYHKITDRSVRNTFLELAKSLARETNTTKSE